jgi:regulator of replication initiation timing
MNANTDDNQPSGVPPHAGMPWRDKYEYMKRLWLNDKDEILRLHDELQKTATEMQGQLAKKNMDIIKLEEDKYTLFKDITRLQEELTKKDTEVMSLKATILISQVAVENTSLTSEVSSAKLKENPKQEEETVVKNINRVMFLSKECTIHFTILIILVVSILIMDIISKKSSLLLLTIDKTSLLLPSP